MSRVYKLRAQDGFEWLFPVKDADYDIFDDWDGSGSVTDWVPIEVRADDPTNKVGRRRRHNSKYKPAKETDMFKLDPGTPVFSGRAWDLLRPLIGPHVQALPLICDEGEFWAINVTTTIPEVFDWARSDYCMFDHDPSRICILNRVVLKHRDSAWPPIFKLGPSVTGSWVFVSDQFRQAVDRLKLAGAAFHPIQVSGASAIS